MRYRISIGDDVYFSLYSLFLKKELIVRLDIILVSKN